LEQNMPNPVAETTMDCASTLAQAGPATLTLRDASGPYVLVRELEAVAGRQRARADAQVTWGASGVLSYTVTAGDFTATKKMVVVR
jgi:hypothetical protein